jgi:predicted phosphoribosyltransferase
MSDKISPFPNLRSAGEQLAMVLSRRGFSAEFLVLAIVTAGVPVAFEVAKLLGAPLELLLIRALTTPGGPGTQACAVSVGGHLVIDDRLPPLVDKPEKPFDYFMKDALGALIQRADTCRGKRPVISVAGRKILLVDCGIRTSLTMQAAIGALRKLNPKSITAAVPVTSAEGRAIVEALADEFICIAEPEPFGNAGMWYRDFRRPGDESISQLLTSVNGETKSANDIA